MANGGAFNKREVGFEHEKTMQLKAPGAGKRNIDCAAKRRGWFSACICVAYPSSSH